MCKCLRAHRSPSYLLIYEQCAGQTDGEGGGGAREKKVKLKTISRNLCVELGKLFLYLFVLSFPKANLQEEFFQRADFLGIVSTVRLSQ